MRAYDPAAGNEAKRIFGKRKGVEIVGSAMAALEGADALAVVTEWQEFRSPDFAAVKAKLKTPAIFDGRNLYDPAVLKAAGLRILSDRENGIDTSKARVLVVGDVMLDRYWFGEVSRISPEAPVPVVLIKDEDERLGGAANVAWNCKELGARIRLLSVVGRDEPGQALERLLRKKGIEASLHRDRGLSTTQKLRVIGRRQQLLRIDFEKPPSGEVLASKLEEFKRALPDCGVVILSDYGKGGLAHIAVMIKSARRAGKRVLVDPKGDDYLRYKGCSIITPNVAELREVVGRWKDEKDLKSRAQALRAKLGLEALLLTRGEDGMTLFSRSRILNVKAEAREVFDVTGAGDTVIATLAVMLAAGAGLESAVRIANRAAGIVVGKLGTATASARGAVPRNELHHRHRRRRLHRLEAGRRPEPARHHAR